MSSYTLKNSDFSDPKNAVNYPVWQNMSQAERDDRARFVAARDWAGLLSKYPRTVQNWGTWTVPSSRYSWATVNKNGEFRRGSLHKIGRAHV